MHADIGSVVVIEDEKELRDLAGLLVPAAGSLQETGSQTDPYRLVDPAGGQVVAVTAYFRDLQAAGRSAATLRSYGDGSAAVVPVLVGGRGAVGPGDAGRGA